LRLVPRTEEFCEEVHDIALLPVTEMEESKMKKIFSIMALIAAFTLFLPEYSCEATDVWVNHWNSENIDIYVMDDTIRGGTSDTGKYFKVSTKKVRNGELIDIVNWSFSKYKTDMWRYETSTMDGTHTTVVLPGNQVFHFCMNALGWPYTVKEYWCY